MNEEGTNRTALVTGGTRGIGRGICELLKERGYHVVAGYGGDAEKAKAFTAETGIPAYQWDVSDFEASQNAVAEIIADNGTISVLVNNADPAFAPKLDFNNTVRKPPFDVGAYETEAQATNPGWQIKAGFKK